MVLTFSDLRDLMHTCEMINAYTALEDIEFKLGFDLLQESACSFGSDWVVCKTVRALYVKSWALDCILTLSTCWVAIRAFEWCTRGRSKMVTILMALTFIHAIFETTGMPFPTGWEEFKNTCRAAFVQDSLERGWDAPGLSRKLGRSLLTGSAMATAARPGPIIK